MLVILCIALHQIPAQYVIMMIIWRLGGHSIWHIPTATIPKMPRRTTNDDGEWPLSGSFYHTWRNRTNGLWYGDSSRTSRGTHQKTHHNKPKTIFIVAPRKYGAQHTGNDISVYYCSSAFWGTKLCSSGFLFVVCASFNVICNEKRWFETSICAAQLSQC